MPVRYTVTVNGPYPGMYKELTDTYRTREIAAYYAEKYVYQDCQEQVDSGEIQEFYVGCDDVHCIGDVCFREKKYTGYDQDNNVLIRAYVVEHKT